jgi:hypothetical protein
MSRLNQINPQLITDSDQINKNIRKLLFDLFQLFLGKLCALLLRQPLEMFDQLRGLGNESHGKVLRRMKLVPVTLLCELPQSIS